MFRVLSSDNIWLVGVSSDIGWFFFGGSLLVFIKLLVVGNLERVEAGGEDVFFIVIF